MWVLEINQDTTFTGLPVRQALHVESLEAGAVSVTQISADSKGQSVEQRRYVIALHLSVPSKQLERLILRNQATGATEEWSVAGGKLRDPNRWARRANGVPHC